MLNNKENFNQLEMDTIQQEPLFTELAPEAAAVAEGSGGFSEKVNFDAYDSTQRFSVKPGGTINLTTNTSSGKNNRYFSAAIRNVNTNNTNTKSVKVGKDTIKWTGVRGGIYQIVFTDTSDRVRVSGTANVSYT